MPGSPWNQTCYFKITEEWNSQGIVCRVPAKKNTLIFGGGIYRTPVSSLAKQDLCRMQILLYKRGNASSNGIFLFPGHPCQWPSSLFFISEFKSRVTQALAWTNVFIFFSSIFFFHSLAIVFYTFLFTHFFITSYNTHL